MGCMFELSSSKKTCSPVSNPQIKMTCVTPQSMSACVVLALPMLAAHMSRSMVSVSCSALP